MMELWDALDRDGHPLGTTLVRGEPIPEGQYHMVCGVLVKHMDGTILLMKRDPNKDGWPGVFEASAGGAAQMGETPLMTAKRELAEETGIRRGTFTKLYTDRGRSSLYHGFLCETDWPKDEITLQEGETVDYRWVTEEELRRMMPIRPHVVVVQAGMLRWLNGQKAPFAMDGGLICEKRA